MINSGREWDWMDKKTKMCKTQHEKDFTQKTYFTICKISKANKHNIVTDVIYNGKRYDLINWKDILAWRNLPSYKRWVIECPPKLLKPKEDEKINN